MALAQNGTRPAPTVDTTPDGIIILTALGAVPEVLRELGVEPEAVLATGLKAVPPVGSKRLPGR